MDFIFLRGSTTASITPILTLITHKPETIMGCVLLGQNGKEELPDWFTYVSHDNSAEGLLECVDNGEKLEELGVFLVVREPNSLLQFNVLAAVCCCNLNYSGEGSSGGRKVLELLAKHNIRTYSSDIQCPAKKYNQSFTEWHEDLKKAFEESFSRIAKPWLLECWGLPEVRY